SASHYQQAEKEAFEAVGSPGPEAAAEEQRRAAAEAQLKALKTVEERNISAYVVLQHLGFCEEERKAPNKKITGTDDVFRELLEASFAILPEDGPPRKGQKDSSFGAAAGAAAAAAAAAGRSRLTEKERAEMQYAAFS
ncbi:hypothetical protein, conserved, partial [Eimeria acervulina]